MPLTLTVVVAMCGAGVATGGSDGPVGGTLMCVGGILRDNNRDLLSRVPARCDLPPDAGNDGEAAGGVGESGIAVEDAWTSYGTLAGFPSMGQEKKGILESPGGRDDLNFVDTFAVWFGLRWRYVRYSLEERIGGLSALVS